MGRRAYGHDITKRIIELYAAGKTYDEISAELDVHRQTVYNKLAKYKNLLKQKEEENEEKIAEVIDQIMGQKPKEIVNNVLSILSKRENIESEFLERGLDPLNRVLGTIVDKAIKLQELEQKQQMSQEQETAQDNFFNAMTKALDKLVDVDSLIDSDSLVDDDEDVS